MIEAKFLVLYDYEDELKTHVFFNELSMNGYLLQYNEEPKVSNIRVYETNKITVDMNIR